MGKRILTAMVLIALVISILVWAPIWLFKIFILAMIFGALREYYRLLIPNDTFAMITGLAMGLVFSAGLMFAQTFEFVVPLLIASLFIITLLHMWYYTTVEGSISRMGLILFGTMYLSFTLPAFAWLRSADHGRSLIIMTIAIVALGDTFAMLGGRFFGKHKMSPLISPKKTMEGLVGSFFGGILAAVICWKLLWPELPVLLVIFLGISVALIGAMGDLVESLIKRAVHIKDSGTLLPGHGGVLDRVDALVFAAPFVYFVFKFLGKI